MVQQLSDRKDIDFVIWDQMKGEQLFQYKDYKDFNRKTCDMIISEARHLAIKELLPTLREGDRQGVRFDKGEVKTPDSFLRAHQLLLEGEWGNLAASSEMGGQNTPGLVSAAAQEYFMGGNWALFGYVALGIHAAEMIHEFGTQEQRERYVGKLISGEWGGTMLLTEPNAGSDVGNIETTAVRNSDGTYTLTGSKIFISNGEHDLCENIIHPVLARIEGDPKGTQGISIFIVPKYFVNSDKRLGKRNDIICTGVEEKMGIHGSATCSMSLGSNGRCIGFLLGKQRDGIKIMFHMMNGARMETALQALGYASSAYLEAVNYARTRIQGRDLVDMANPEAPSVAIIKHPDVRRNLLWMKSHVDGMRSFYYFASLCQTKAKLGETEKERQYYGDLFEFFTPLVKDYLAVRGHEVCIQAMQVFGGAGYTCEYPVEQYARDSKIVSIYEGTSGIQAMDLLGRKLGMRKGKVFMDFISEMNSSIATAKEMMGLKALADTFEEAVARLGEVAVHLGKQAISPDFKVAFAHSHPFLESVGDMIVGWMLLWRARVASEKLNNKAKKKEERFYEGQLKTTQFFMETILPVTMGRLQAVQSGCNAAIKIQDDAFGGL